MKTETTMLHNQALLPTRTKIEKTQQKINKKTNWRSVLILKEGQKLRHYLLVRL